VIVACDLAQSNLKFVSPKLISQATERLRDKKVLLLQKVFIFYFFVILCLYTVIDTQIMLFLYSGICEKEGLT
jgi:hypothetical protein